MSGGGDEGWWWRGSGSQRGRVRGGGGSISEKLQGRDMAASTPPATPHPSAAPHPLQSPPGARPSPFLANVPCLPWAPGVRSAALTPRLASGEVNLGVGRRRSAKGRGRGEEGRVEGNAERMMLIMEKGACMETGKWRKIWTMNKEQMEAYIFFKREKHERQQ